MSEKKINIKLQSKTDVSGLAVFEKQMNKIAAQVKNNPITKMAKSIHLKNKALYHQINRYGSKCSGQ